MNSDDENTFLTALQAPSRIEQDESIFLNENARKMRFDIIQSNISELDPQILDVN